MREEIEFLLRQNKELYEKYNLLLSQSKDESKELTDSYEKILEENKELRNRLLELEGRILEVASEKTEEALQKVEGETEEAGETEKADETEETSLQASAKAVNAVAAIAGMEEKDIDYPSKAIGEAVVLCASVCQEFKRLDPKLSNDLVNLALGKTELFKSEVMEIAISGADDVLAKAQINTKMSELAEYFELLKRQN